MRIFDAMLIVGVVAIIALSAIYTESAFVNLSVEANNGTASSATDATTLAQYQQDYAWIYVLGILGVVLAIILAYKLLHDAAT
jgi:glycerol uptake facilitator-like aquaporin